MTTLSEVISEGPSNGYSPTSSADGAGPLTLKLSATTSGEMRLDDTTVKRVTEQIGAGSKYWLEPGDLLIQRANTLDYVGAAAIYDGPSAKYIYPDLMMRVRIPVPDLRHYVWRFLNSSVARGYFRSKATGTAGNMPKINGETVRSLPLPLPPVNELRRIVTKLDSLLARCRRAKEDLDSIPAMLERFRQSVLATAFRGDLTRDWREANPHVEPASDLLERIRAERRRRWEAVELERMLESGKAPKDERWKSEYKEPELTEEPAVFGPVAELGWCMATVEALCDPNRGVPYGIVQTGDETAGGVPTVRCGDIKDFGINLPMLKRVNPSIEQQYARTRLNGGEVLLAIRGTVGGVAVASEEMRGMNISREVAMLPVLPGVNPRFVMYLLASPDATALLAGRTKGVAQQGVNLSDLRSFPVPLPSLAEQAQIVRRVDAAMTQARAAARNCADIVARMPSLENAILAKAFRGELVPQDPADEPASVLLERSRAERDQSADNESSPRPKRRRVTKAG